jgi:hypothetical protein
MDVNLWSVKIAFLNAPWSLPPIAELGRRAKITYMAIQAVFEPSWSSRQEFSPANAQPWKSVTDLIKIENIT